MMLLKSNKMKSCLLISLLICMLTSGFYGYAAAYANSSASGSEITTSDVFFVYPNSLRQAEPNLRSLRVAAEDAVTTMESDGEFWSMFQTALADPEGGAVAALKDWINGTDTRGADCALSATEDLLSQIASSSELYEFGQYCTGPYQEFYKLAKQGKNVEDAVESLAEFYFETRHEKVEGILTAILSEQSDAVRELVLLDMDEHQDELLNAIDKGTEGVSEAMELLKFANRFTELIETITLLDSVEDEMIDYLCDTVTTEDLKEAIQTYRSYKASNYVSYVADKWIKEEYLDELADLFEEAVQGICMGGGVHPSTFSLYEGAKLILSLYGKFIGKKSGYGDADTYITTYKSWNYVQEMERVLSEKRASIIYDPCTMDKVCEYERAYELYVAAVIAFAKNAKEANSNAAEGINYYLGIVEGMRNSYSENRIGPFYAHIQRCKDYLALEENRESCYRKIPDNGTLNYTISKGDDVTVRASSNNLDADSIYAAQDGNLFYGIELNGGTLEVACDARVPGDVTIWDMEYSLTVADGASLHVDGDLNTEQFNGTYSYAQDRRTEINGDLTVDGNLGLNYGTLTVVGDNAKLEANGDAYLISVNAADSQSGELIFNGGLNSDIGDIGQATVYLNTPADKEAGIGGVNLTVPEDSDEAAGTNAAANVILRKGAAEEGQEARNEISGNAPSHELTINTDHIQRGKSLFRTLKLCASSGTPDLTIAGETEISGDMTIWGMGYSLTVADGASLHVDGDLNTEQFNGTYSYAQDRRTEINGDLTVDGNLGLNYGTLTVAGDNAKLEANGDAYLISVNAADSQSGELIFNGGLNSDIGDIGQATVYLNTPADKEAGIGGVNLTVPEDSDEAAGTNAAANVILRKEAAEEGQEARNEISGNAPSHELTINTDHIQRGKSLFRTLKLRASSGTPDLTIAGETEISGDMTIWGMGYSLTVADGASLHVDGDLNTEQFNGSYSYAQDRRTEINGDLTVDGNLGLNYGTLTVAGDNAKLEANGDAYLISVNAAGSQSGRLIFNGGVDSDINDIGCAEVILTGQSDGSIHIMGINVERNGASPNMRIVKEDDIVLIGPYAENRAPSAASMILCDHSYELTDGTYDIGTVTLKSGSLDLNHSLVFNGNLALNGESAEQSEDNSSVVVRGDFSSHLSEGIFSGGELKVAGDFAKDGPAAFLETGSHRTILNGAGAQTIWMYWEGNHFNILELENTSEEGVTFSSDVYVDRLFDHRRRHFTLAVSEEDRFADYDNDGIKDHLDPYPKDPDKSFIAFAIQPIADQAYTGDELTPELTVIDEENYTLRAGTDYEVAFADNTRPGTATAVVTGKGFHSTSEEVNFNIVCHHSWGKWEFVEVPTANEAGSKERTCEICGEKEEESIPALKAVLTLPANLTKIESEAFSGLTSVDAVRIPETVVEIADDAFDGSSVVIIAEPGGYIEEFCNEHGILFLAE